MNPATPTKYKFTRTAANYVPLSPLTFLERAASVYPERTSVVHGSRRYTWSQTYTRCRQLASALRRHGIGDGDTVAIMGLNTPETFEAHFGVPMAGAVLNALNTRLDAKTIAYILQHGEARVLLTDRALSPTIKAALALPKVESPDAVKMIAAFVAELERERGLNIGAIQLFVLVETPAGLLRVDEIAAADKRVVAVGFGTGDFALSTGIQPSPETFLSPALQIVIAARAAGCVPLGLLGTIDDFTDLERFRLIAQRSCLAGFRGAPCIHPRQVQILNETFRPTPEAVRQARQVIAAFEEETSSGKGAIQLQGKMVDSPVAHGARLLLAEHEAILAREAARRSMAEASPRD